MSYKNKHQENCSLCQTTTEVLNKLNSNNYKIKNKKRKLKKIKILLFLFLIIILVIIGIYKLLFNPLPKNIIIKNNLNQEIKKKKTGPQINSFAPNFISKNILGEKITLSDFKNKKPVLIVFWSTWCKQCAEEFEDLKIFNKKHYNDIQIIAIASGESEQTIKDYLQRKNTDILVILDEHRKIWNQYLVRGTPSHFLINKKGIIINIRPGAVSLANLETILSMVLNK